MRIRKSTGCVLDMRMREGSGAVVGDASRYGDHGAVHGGCAWGERGMVFDGSTGYVDCGNGVTQTLSKNNNYTISLWFKTAATDTRVILASSIVGADRMSMNIHLNILRVGHYDGAAYISKSVAFTDVSNWHHLVMIHHTGSIDAYLDCKEMIGTDFPVTHSVAGSRLGSRTIGDYYFNGSIAAVRIENRARSAREIMKQYETEKHLYL